MCKKNPLALTIVKAIYYKGFDNCRKKVTNRFDRVIFDRVMNLFMSLIKIS